ncbi:unnamed protein product [Rangifer tarandus platyrhynchus]|uniref:Uncharacterized protein n=1 Tax=Rangifer tarandus platyrhynchus TaxID=3082113 RepID=A0AC59ZZ19_RANTA
MDEEGESPLGNGFGYPTEDLSVELTHSHLTSQVTPWLQTWRLPGSKGPVFTQVQEPLHPLTSSSRA